MACNIRACIRRINSRIFIPWWWKSFVLFIHSFTYEEPALRVQSFRGQSFQRSKISDLLSLFIILSVNYSLFFFFLWKIIWKLLRFFIYIYESSFHVRVYKRERITREGRVDREARAQKQRNDYVMYIDYHRIQNGFQVTRFSLPFSALVYGLHIRAPLYPCSRSRWADKTSSKKWTCDIFQRPSFKMCHDIYTFYILCIYIHFFRFSFLFSFVSNHFFFVNAIHRSRYIYIFFFVFVSIIGWFVVFCFIIICHYYRFIVYFFKISSMKISNVKERKKKRESARERSIGFVMSFARVWTNCLFDVYYY